MLEMMRLKTGIYCTFTLVEFYKHVCHARGQEKGHRKMKRGVIKFIDVGEDCTKGCLNLRRKAMLVVLYLIIYKEPLFLMFPALKIFTTQHVLRALYCCTPISNNDSFVLFTNSYHTKGTRVVHVAIECRKPQSK